LQDRKEIFSVFTFIIVICSVCALILATLATILLPLQKQAAEEDLGAQMLISAKILSHKGHFQVQTDSGAFIPAEYDTQKDILVASNKSEKASSSDILKIFENRIKPMLVDDDGNLFTFEEKDINYSQYLNENEKNGFARLKLKLIYEIYSNTSEEKEVIGYVIPINGFGLWGPLYGYLAIESDGKTVIGTTWYDQVETAGLGAEIAATEWQDQFYQKTIFLKSQDGTIDYESSPIGIEVVKGKVIEIYGDSHRASNAVDGVSGATITSKGVMNAYRKSLEPYRPFLVKLETGEQ